MIRRLIRRRLQSLKWNNSYFITSINDATTIVDIQKDEDFDFCVGNPVSLLALCSEANIEFETRYDEGATSNFKIYPTVAYRDKFTAQTALVVKYHHTICLLGVQNRNYSKQRYIKVSLISSSLKKKRYTSSLKVKISSKMMTSIKLSTRCAPNRAKIAALNTQVSCLLASVGPMHDIDRRCLIYKIRETITKQINRGPALGPRGYFRWCRFFCTSSYF